MSDPVTQAEIEDVLSSIRRLVSEDGRSAPRPVPAQAVEHREERQPVSPPQDPQRSRLVLTPALRVADADDGSGGAVRVADQPDTALLSSEAEVSPVADPAYDPQADAYMDLEVEPEMDPGEVLAFRANDPVAAARATESDPADPQIAAEQPEAFPEPSEALHEQVEGDGETAEDAAPWRDPEATLFGAAETPTQDVAAEDAAVSPQVSKTIAEQDWESEEPSLDEEQGVDLDGSQRVSAVVQKIAELEAKVARSSGQWEPDGASSDPYAGTNIETLEWQDHTDEGDAEAEFADDLTPQDQDDSEASFEAATLAEEAVSEATLEALEAAGGEENYLDEDSLRELVADIVRSELQGALGERITRNVRKLVRREIQRALAAQDLI